MVSSRAIAGFAVRGANAMTILRNLHCGPFEVAQSRDESRDHAGLAHAARVSADDDYGHKKRLPAPLSGSWLGLSSGSREPAAGVLLFRQPRQGCQLLQILAQRLRRSSPECYAL